MTAGLRRSRSRRRLRRVLASAPSGAARERSRLPGAAQLAARLRHHRSATPLRPVAGAVVALSAAATYLGGPVAGFVTITYTAVAARGWRRRSARRHIEARRARQLDDLRAAAADLRAGLPAATALADTPGPFADPAIAQVVARRVRAAVALADRTGAPLADLLDRVESDARARDRARATANTQAAGARATTWLLAALPAAGLGLGYAIGADPLQVLLRTPVGAGCAVTAVLLQLAGLAWSARLVRIDEVAR